MNDTIEINTVGGDEREKELRVSSSGLARLESQYEKDEKDELLDQSFDAMSRDPDLSPQLGDAIGMTNRWEARLAETRKEIKQRVFNGDEFRYKRWLAKEADTDATMRGNLMRYELAQRRQYVKQQNEANIELAEREGRDLSKSYINASLAEFAENRHTIQTEYEAKFNEAQKSLYDIEAVIKRAQDIKNAQSLRNDLFHDTTLTSEEVDAFVAQELGLEGSGIDIGEFLANPQEFYEKKMRVVRDIQDEKDARLRNAKADFDRQMTQARDAMRKRYHDLVVRETQFQMRFGVDKNTAFALAINTCGKNAKATLTQLVDDGYGDFVQTFLKELDSPNAGVTSTDDGKGGKSLEWNPHGRLCMSVEQVHEVQDYIKRKIRSDIQSKNLAKKQQEDEWDLVASRIRSEVNQLGVAENLDLKRVEELYKMANELSAAGYDKAHLVTANISSVVNRHARSAQALQKMEAKAAAAKTKELGDVAFRQMIDEFAARPDGVFTVDMMLPDDTGKPVLTKVEMNANNAIAHTIQTAQSLGFLKGANWTKMMGEALAVESQRKIVEVAVNELFDFPVDDSVIVKENGRVKWGDRLKGSSTTITIGLGDHGSVRPDNVGSNMRVRSKVGTEQRYLTSDQLGKVVAEAHRFVKDNPAATKESLMTHLGKVLDKVLLESDAATFGTRMINMLTKANDDFFTNDVYGGMRNGKMELARGRTPIGQLIRQSAMNARFNPAYSALTKNAIIFGDDEEPDLNAMQDEAVEE